MSPLAYLLLVVAGFVAGVVNVLAGGGSFLTLPALIFLGVEPTVANATNRVAIVTQNVGAVWSFGRRGLIARADLVAAALPATAGAAVGTWLALVVSAELFQRLLAFLMVAISLWSLWGPRPRPRPAGTAPPPPRRWLPAAGWTLVGVYGGFVQAGVGFLMLALTTAAGLDLVRGNALKVTVALCFTVLALAVFAASGVVRWLPGLALAAGSLAGGLLGARLAVLKGDRWLRRVVTATIVVFALKLWIDAA